MQILTIPQIKEAAKISASLTGINWDLLEDRQTQDKFEELLNNGDRAIQDLEELYKIATDSLLPYQDRWEEEDRTLFEEFANRLMEEMHAAYTMQYLKETFLAVRDITSPPKPVKKKRVTRKKKPLKEDPE